MTTHAPVPPSHPNEPQSNALRRETADTEPAGQRTYTPSQLVITASQGSYHYTPEGRKLADFTSGVLVANLGHHPPGWWANVGRRMGWDHPDRPMVPLTAYNAVTPLEVEANHRLLVSLRATEHGERLEQVLWAASGSEAVQKSIWACLKRHPDRNVILATRHGFHGKKGLSEAVTGDESSPNRDPRVRFVAFPTDACRDIDRAGEPFDPTPFVEEWEAQWRPSEGRVACAVTEPYLGGGGSYHPPAAYLQALADFCRRRDVPLILDEVQSNFGRTGRMYAFERYGLAPDIVVLGKGMGNGVPVNAAVGRRDLFAALGYGGASDTWSGHPLGCAAVLATLDAFENENVMDTAAPGMAVLERGLRRLKELPAVRHVRGEGWVWGVELADGGPDWPSARVANAVVEACYRGDSDGNAIHLLGPLAGNVLRVSPPLLMPAAELAHYLDVLFERVATVGERCGLARRAA